MSSFGKHGSSLLNAKTYSTTGVTGRTQKMQSDFLFIRRLELAVWIGGIIYVILNTLAKVNIELELKSKHLLSTYHLYPAQLVNEVLLLILTVYMIAFAVPLSLFCIGKYRSAARIYQALSRFLHKAPLLIGNMPWCIDTYLADCYQEMGDFTQAEHLYKKVLEAHVAARKNPLLKWIQSKDVVQRYSLLLRKSNRNDEAQVLERHLDSGFKLLYWTAMAVEIACTIILAIRYSHVHALIGHY